MNKRFLRYHQALDYLEGFLNLPDAYPHDGKHPSRYIEYLKRTQYFFDLLKNPHKKIKAVHVAGTSGKGTTAAYIQAILTSAGYKTGLYTTPYATSFIEEFKVNDKYIAPDELADIINNLKPFIDKAYAQSPYGGPSHFEIKTAIALVYFARQNCDYIVLETGLGGEFDATNAKTNKVASVITNIGLDHTDILGKTLPSIAKAKAGIIEPRVPVFTAEKNPKILELFYKIAKKNHAPITVVDSANPNQDIASTVCAHLGVNKKNIHRGLKNMFLPARFEHIPKTNVILDGAHNQDKIRYALTKLSNLKYNKLFVIYASAQNKSTTKILRLIRPFANTLILTRFNNPFRACANPYELAKNQDMTFFSRGAGKKGHVPVFLDANQALDYALSKANKKDLILVTGSFFLTGQLRARYYSEDFILKKRLPR